MSDMMRMAVVHNRKTNPPAFIATYFISPLPLFSPSNESYFEAKEEKAKRKATLKSTKCENIAGGMCPVGDEYGQHKHALLDSVMVLPFSYVRLVNGTIRRLLAKSGLIEGRKKINRTKASWTIRNGLGIIADKDRRENTSYACWHQIEPHWSSRAGQSDYNTHRIVTHLRNSRKKPTKTILVHRLSNPRPPSDHHHRKKKELLPISYGN